MIRVATSEKPLFGRVRLSDIVLWATVVLVVVITLFPFLWAIITSFKTPRDALEATYIPYAQFEPTLDNWDAELGLGWRETSKALKNSAVISIGATTVAIMLGTLTGYGLATFQYGIGNRNLVSWFLSQRFLPPVATLIPFLLMLKELELIDTLRGMIIINATFVLPFAVLIMRDFFAELPQEIQESAMVDGANHFQVFWRIALPLAGPAVAAAAVICFAFAWNEFLFASVLASRNAQPYTVMIASTGTVRGIQFNFVATRMVIAVTLPVVMSFFVQKYIVRGLTMGAVKG